MDRCTVCLVKINESSVPSLIMVYLSVVDCAEGTLRQFALQPYTLNSNFLRPDNVKKVFITHMHGK
jgi:ribonuclease BN (tRNA processing enzyme)